MPLVVYTHMQTKSIQFMIMINAKSIAQPAGINDMKMVWMSITAWQKLLNRPVLLAVNME